MSERARALPEHEHWCGSVRGGRRRWAFPGHPLHEARQDSGDRQAGSICLGKRFLLSHNNKLYYQTEWHSKALLDRRTDILEFECLVQVKRDLK